jgi:hypothetical protein
LLNDLVVRVDAYELSERALDGLHRCTVLELIIGHKNGGKCARGVHLGIASGNLPNSGIGDEPAITVAGPSPRAEAAETSIVNDTDAPGRAELFCPNLARGRKASKPRFESSSS